MTWMLATDWLWRPALPAMQVAALAFVLAALAIFVLVRHWRSGPGRALVFCGMRLLIIGVLSVLLLGPSRVPESHSAPDKPIVSIVVDTSASMQTADESGRPRIEAAVERWLSRDQIAEMREHFDVRLHGFDESLRPMVELSLRRGADELATGNVTHLTDALTEAVIAIPGGSEDTGNAVIVVSDGHDTDRRPLGQVATLANNRSIAMHTVTVGAETSPPDVAVAAFTPQAYLLAGETGQVIAKIFQSGLDGKEATVELTDPAGTTTRHPVAFDARGSATLELPVTPEGEGLLEYRVHVPPAPGEKVTTNNTHVVFVESIKRRMKVLVLEGEPFWDTKFIAQSLRTDPWVELTHISQVSSTKREGIVTRTDGGEAKAPTKADELAAYDVIVLGAGIERVLTSAMIEGLVDYVDAGGNVVFARGQAYDPTTRPGKAAAKHLAPIEPVKWARGLVYPSARTKFELTSAGRGSASFALAGVSADVDRLVSRLPVLKVMPQVASTKPGAQVLARLMGSKPIDSDGARGVPAVVTMNYGGGRVFAVLGEGLWRWSFLPPDLRDVSGVFDVFWSNTIRSLAMGGAFEPGRSIAMNVAPTSVRLGDPVTLEVTTRVKPPEGFSPRVTVTAPDGLKKTIDQSASADMPMRRVTEIDPKQAGVWTVTLAPTALNAEPITRRFSVYDLNLERLRPAARPEAMAALSQRTGGLALRSDSTIDLAQALRRKLAARQAPPTPEYAWDAAWLMVALLLWAGLEWLGRRQAGWL